MNYLNLFYLENFNLPRFRYIPLSSGSRALECDLCGEVYAGFEYEERVNSLFQKAIISLANLFGMILFRSRKWALIRLEKSNSWAYINTWSFTQSMKDRLQEVRKLEEIWQEVKLKGEPAYISRKINLTKHSYWLTPRHIFMKLKNGVLSSPGDGFSKRCKKAIDLLSSKTVARLVPLSRARKMDKTCLFLLKEMSFLQRLKGCPGIVQMLDVEERLVLPNLKKRAIYLDFYNQGDLFSCYIERRCCVNSLDKKIKIIGDLIQAVASMHKEGIVHNDIKMENVLIREGEEGVEGALCDFDLASDDKKNPENISGSALWSSPEKIWANQSQVEFSYEDRKKADVWALGLVLYIVLLDKIPFFFTGESQESIQHGIKQLFFLYKRPGTFFEKPWDRNSIKFLIWQILQCDASKRPNMERVAKRWGFLASRRHLVF